MPIFLQFVLPYISSFFIISFAIVGGRLYIFMFGCDPKFSCFCSMVCLIKPTLICTLILAATFLMVYWFAARGQNKSVNKSQLCLLTGSGSL